eukprot:CAMPEP_0203868548 /NCGR_PEP_ID=MMETSP0359-20131031/17169_1 /ASSEMBLY_ACC=CAM_ASM_000338 /TAXON_ID=268821 /ORGANISM="Scrippsiella Hangoei, Strain SHTV-5" /LENGTH=61 /DNA_ID=CAMNT_0050786971 /DNA_START=161 /DNA_END=343 /DNA_ORIENTATION=-
MCNTQDTPSNTVRFADQLHGDARTDMAPLASLVCLGRPLSWLNNIVGVKLKGLKLKGAQRN